MVPAGPARAPVPAPPSRTQRTGFGTPGSQPAGARAPLTCLRVAHFGAPSQAEKEAQHLQSRVRPHDSSGGPGEPSRIRPGAPGLGHRSGTTRAVQRTGGCCGGVAHCGGAGAGAGDGAGAGWQEGVSVSARAERAAESRPPPLARGCRGAGRIPGAPGPCTQPGTRTPGSAFSFPGNRTQRRGRPNSPR